MTPEIIARAWAETSGRCGPSTRGPGSGSSPPTKRPNWSPCVRPWSRPLRSPLFDRADSARTHFLVHSCAMGSRRPPLHPARAVSVAEVVAPEIIPLAADAERVLQTWLADKHESTVQKYRGDLGDFAAWMHESSGRPLGVRGVNVPPRLVTDALALLMGQPQPLGFALGLQFKNHLLVERKLSSNTVNRKLAAVRSYIKMAHQVGACAWELRVPGVESELARDVRGPGAAGYAGLVAAAEIRIAAAESAGDLRSGGVWIRNLALLRLYHDAALRRMEPLTIDYPEDVDFGDPSTARLRFRGKKRRHKAWFDIGSLRAVQSVQRWIDVRGDSPGPLFCSLHHGHWGQRLHVRTVNKFITDSLGGDLDIRVTPHGLRHTSATSLLDKTGGDVRGVAEFLRHKSLGTAQRYDDDRKNQAKRMGRLIDE